MERYLSKFQVALSGHGIQIGRVLRGKGHILTIPFWNFTRNMEITSMARGRSQGAGEGHKADWSVPQQAFDEEDSSSLSDGENTDKDKDQNCKTARR